MIEKATAEFEIEVSNGQITCEQVIPDGKYKLVVEVATTTEDTTCNQQKGIFKKVPVSELRLDDAFMKHQPKTKSELDFKNLVEIVIKNGLKDFWRPVCDPSIDDIGRICYQPGEMPAVGKPYSWWEHNAKKFAPECESRLGTELEYVAFLATVIKDLVAADVPIALAWHAVCIDSNKLGHYLESGNTKIELEKTGSRKRCGWCDFGNTYKILASHKETCGFWIASGNYLSSSTFRPLASFCHYYFGSIDYPTCCSGWLVLDSCPDC